MNEQFQNNINWADKTILIAEDEQINFFILSEILRRTGSTIIHAPDGQVAVDYCRSNPEINIILMDIKMPIMNGFTATNIIKSFRPDIPIIAQTAYTNEKSNILANGFDDFLSKPIKRELLLCVIEKFFKTTD